MSDPREDLYIVAALLADLDRVLNPLPVEEYGSIVAAPALPPPLPPVSSRPPPASSGPHGTPSRRAGAASMSARSAERIASREVSEDRGDVRPVLRSSLPATSRAVAHPAHAIVEAEPAGRAIAPRLRPLPPRERDHAPVRVDVVGPNAKALRAAPAQPAVETGDRERPAPTARPTRASRTILASRPPLSRPDARAASQPPLVHAPRRPAEDPPVEHTATVTTAGEHAAHTRDRTAATSLEQARRVAPPHARHARHAPRPPRLPAGRRAGVQMPVESVLDVSDGPPPLPQRRPALEERDAIVEDPASSAFDGDVSQSDQDAVDESLFDGGEAEPAHDMAAFHVWLRGRRLRITGDPAALARADRRLARRTRLRGRRL